jgi:hypothetical protein
MPPSRVLYDGLPIGFHTWVWEEDRTRLDVEEKLASGQEYYAITGQPDVFPQHVVEVEDLFDPKSRRAFIVRDHLASCALRCRPACSHPRYARVVSGPGLKEPDAPAAPSSGGD